MVRKHRIETDSHRQESRAALFRRHHRQTGRRLRKPRNGAQLGGPGTFESILSLGWLRPPERAKTSPWDDEAGSGASERGIGGAGHRGHSGYYSRNKPSALGSTDTRPDGRPGRFRLDSRPCCSAVRSTKPVLPGETGPSWGYTGRPCSPIDGENKGK